MKISIITISYNQAQFLKDCIQSVVNQGGEVEHIVIDGGSTDESVSVIKNFKEQIAYWTSEPDDGPADALNKGFLNATGEICCYLNSDDRLVEGALDTVREFFEQNPWADVIYGDCRTIDAEGSVTGILVSSKRFSSYRYLLQSTMVAQPSTFFRRTAFNRTGGFSLSNKTCWDGELLLEMYYSGSRFKYLPKILSEFRIHSDSITGSGSKTAEYQYFRKRLFERKLNRPYTLRDRCCALIFKAQDYPRRVLRKRMLKLSS